MKERLCDRVPHALTYDKGKQLYQIFDISPPLSESSPVWPGDTSLSRQIQARLEDGDTINLSSLTTTVHIGAHADAPSHYDRGGLAIDQVELDPYLGDCQVISCLGATLVSKNGIKGRVTPGTKRLLVKTSNKVQPEAFSESFAHFDGEVIEYLHTLGVVLVGIDTPSVDHFSSKDLPAHHALHKHGMRNLEGLDLSAVEPGNYELIALPLRLVGFDASPVRAILRRPA